MVVYYQHCMDIFFFLFNITYYAGFSFHFSFLARCLAVLLSKGFFNKNLSKDVILSVFPSQCYGNAKGKCHLKEL